MTASPLIADMLGRPGMFYRSVALERDVSDPSAGQSYVTTPWLERGAREIINGISAGGTRRAWRIIGDFGVGKSALALALVQALDPRVSDPAMPMRRLAEAVADVPRMFPLIVTGSRKGLREGLAAAIAGAVEADGLLDDQQRARVLAAEEPFDAVIALRDAVRETARFDGLLLVVDEMGKFLEPAAEGADADVYRLQGLAEAAARSGDSPLAVILILHKGFQSYGEDWRAARRSEWEKVAERFEEMIFDHPLSHTAALLSAALGDEEGTLPAKVRKSYEETVRRVRALGWLGPRNGAGAAGCWPVHPAAVPVLARFFAAFGQNERSLFGFAASEEPGALRSFASGTPISGDLYCIHDFFDYVSTSFGHRLTSRAGAGEWERIGAVLERAADADEIETAALKTIGILNLIDAPDLPATTESVREALAPAFAPAEADAAVARLLTGGLLFRRPGRAELRLWTSRRVDLSAIWEEAEREVEAAPILGDLPRHLATLPIRGHLLARRHSVRSGTNRRFAVRCTHVSALGGYAGHGDADGGIVAVLCAGAEDMRMARAWCAEITQEHPTRLAVPVRPMRELGAAIVDLLRHRWVVANAATLQEDAFAAAEIERTIADLEGALTAKLETALGLKGHAPLEAVDLYWKGSFRSLAKPMHAAVSDLCDRVYDEAPRVENELVNRHALTTAGAGARQRLIDAMFAHAHDPELGFKAGKNPPERALYLSLLRRGRVHRQTDGAWTLAPPEEDDDPLRLKPALDAIASRLSREPGRVALTEVYDEVEGRPFGVRRGLSPLLLAITLIAAGHRVALFERGTYCTRIDGAAFMRMLKSPGHFALQWVSLEGVRADVFRRLARLFDRPDTESGIRGVVDPLIRFGVGLPFHVQRSAALSPEAKAVRQALAQARSPIDLVFADLPAACGEEPFGLGGPNHGERAGRFVERLDAAVAELRGCYPLLLQSMRSELLDRLGAPDRASARERAAAISFRVREQILRTFALRIADGVLADDGWIEAVGGAIIGKPPERWLDADVELWRSRLADLAAQFQRVEAVSFGEVEVGRNAVRVSLTRVDGEERSVIVDLAELTQDQVDALGAIGRMAEEANLSLDKVAALLSIESMDRDGAEQASETTKAEVKSK